MSMIFLPTLDEDDNEYCYVCETTRLTPANQRDAWVTWDAVTRVHICDDPQCAENDEIFTDQPALVTCDGYLEWPDQLRGLDGVPCREEYFASRDRPTCPTCGCEHEFAQAVAEGEVSR